MKKFWNNKKVLITGNTGFKGSWLAMWLHVMGARVYGFAKLPVTNPSLFDVCDLKSVYETQIGDIRDYEKVLSFAKKVNPDIVFHMAAQPLVRYSYKYPLETYEVNVMGTTNILEVARSLDNLQVLVNVTTDKCYENQEWYWGYRENEKLGGYDPYSSSKACSEIITAAYRQSYFSKINAIKIATARAGNVIGGGDWSCDRLIPDCIRAMLKGEVIVLRNPKAIRPWQHVLEPLRGYLMLAQKLFTAGEHYAEAWNFGPNDDDSKTVEWIVQKLCQLMNNKNDYIIEADNNLHEAKMLKLDCSKAKERLGWEPCWRIEDAIRLIADWYNRYNDNEKMLDVCVEQINRYGVACENR